MLCGFQSMSNGHLRQVNTTKHRVKLRGKNTQLIYSAPYRALLKVIEIEKGETNKVPAQIAIEPT